MNKIAFEVKYLVLQKLQEQNIDVMDFEKALASDNPADALRKLQADDDGKGSKGILDRVGQFGAGALKGSAAAGGQLGLLASRANDEVGSIFKKLDEERALQQAYYRQIRQGQPA